MNVYVGEFCFYDSYGDYLPFMAFGNTMEKALDSMRADAVKSKISGGLFFQNVVEYHGKISEWKPNQY